VSATQEFVTVAQEFVKVAQEFVSTGMDVGSADTGFVGSSVIA